MHNSILNYDILIKLDVYVHIHTITLYGIQNSKKATIIRQEENITLFNEVRFFLW